MKTVGALAALGVLLASSGRGDEPPSIDLKVGEAKNLCENKLVVCPVSSFICDDPKVATIEYGPEGALLRGVSPGTTLCSVLGYGAFRRVIRATVN